MNDLEITKKCAIAMGADENGRFWRVVNNPPTIVNCKVEVRFDPLHDDAQMVALYKKFKLSSYWVDGSHNIWVVSGDHRPNGESADLNRAVCECVAKMGTEHAE